MKNTIQAFYKKAEDTNLKSKIYIKNYYVDTFRDNFKNGETGEHGSYWNISDEPIKEKSFNTVKDALDAVMKTNYFEPTKFWEKNGGKFYTSILVDDDNSQVKENSELFKEWKKGEIDLWSAIITVELGRKIETDLDENDKY